MSHKQPLLLPQIKGKKWLATNVPKNQQAWTLGKPDDTVQSQIEQQTLKQALRPALLHGKWQWPKRTVYFLADPHADADAFVESLVISGGVKKTGSQAEDFELTKEGRKGLFIIGGDCLDKGPNNLRLLSTLKILLDMTPRVLILAGNHDMRLLMGLRSLQLPSDPHTEHFFMRMSPKVAPLLKEVYDRYLQDDHALTQIPDKKECRRQLYPSRDWFNTFPVIAEWVMPPHIIRKEIGKLRRKSQRFESACNNYGLTLRMAYAAAKKCQQLFLQPSGEYYWFFKRMRLAYQTGSFLFIHAGLDDRVASLIEEKGVRHINKLYQRQLKHDLFEFYYGPIANTIRTKYRPVDMPLTKHGVDRLHRSGIKAVVHGHRNRLDGQRMMLRQGLLHFECDTTMDTNSRKKEGLKDYGAGVTVLRPEGQVLGICSDYHYIKVFRP